MSYQLILGDALTVLRTLEAGSVQTCVTSPPYFGLRSYLPDDHPDKALELGTEQTPEQFVAKLVDVFREVKRVLRSDGTLWLNLGDSYANDGKWGGSTGGKHAGGLHGDTGIGRGKVTTGAKPKDLLMIPARVALALQADGWYLRSAITWCKGNPMPESVTDRCTSATEMVFMLAKSERYFYDAEAVKEEAKPESYERYKYAYGGAKAMTLTDSSQRNDGYNEMRSPSGRNRRNWWVVNSEPYAGSHYATMPTKLVEPCILAGTSAHGCCAACGAPWERVVERGEGKFTDQDERSYVPPGQTPHSRQKINPNNRHEWGHYAQPTQTTGWQPTCTCNADVVPCTVLDPFFGSGTVGAVALKHGRRFIGIDIDARNLDLARKRIEQSQPMLLEPTP